MCVQCDMNYLVKRKSFGQAMHNNLPIVRFGQTIYSHINPESFPVPSSPPPADVITASNLM